MSKTTIDPFSEQPSVTKAEDVDLDEVRETCPWEDFNSTVQVQNRVSRSVESLQCLQSCSKIEVPHGNLSDAAVLQLRDKVRYS